MCLAMALPLKSCVILEKSLTSLDLLPYAYNGRVDQAVPYFDDSICLSVSHCYISVLGMHLIINGVL